MNSGLILSLTGCLGFLTVDNRPTSCVEVKKHSSQNGVYTIYPDSATPIDVYCDQETDGGGWAVIQRRMDGSENFYRNWTAYEEGFGLLTGEFWLGLKKMHLLTSSQPQTLRVDVEDFATNKAYAQYKLFNLTGPQSNYTIHLDGFFGTAGDSMVNVSYYSQTSQDMAFSTPDRDNDLSSGKCAVSGGGPWWYYWCADANLNSLYGKAGVTSWSYMHWKSWYGDSRALKASQMKVRPALNVW